MFAFNSVSNNKNLSLNITPAIYLVDAYEILHNKKLGYKEQISYLSKQLAISICSNYSAIPRSNLYVLKNVYGKPYIVEKPDFFFSISHSGL